MTISFQLSVFALILLYFFKISVSLKLNLIKQAKQFYLLTIRRNLELESYGQGHYC
jgi:hypothetical protein